VSPVRIWDPVLFLIPGSGIQIRDGKKFRSGMNILELIFENLGSVFWVKKKLKFFDADPG
jgi:hypothetical protein